MKLKVTAILCLTITVMLNNLTASTCSAEKSTRQQSYRRLVTRAIKRRWHPPRDCRLPIALLSVDKTGILLELTFIQTDTRSEPCVQSDLQAICSAAPFEPANPDNDKVQVQFSPMDLKPTDRQLNNPILKATMSTIDSSGIVDRFLEELVNDELLDGKADQILEKEMSAFSLELQITKGLWRNYKRALQARKISTFRDYALLLANKWANKAAAPAFKSSLEKLERTISEDYSTTKESSACFRNLILLIRNNLVESG